MTLHFGSKEKFRRWNAYRFIHGIPTEHKQKVMIAGKLHHTKHAKEHHIRKMHALLDKYVV